MERLALYRKYRSADFDAVVGQDHITRSLKQAVAAKRISHAYLFSGPRGVGKTSVARILARAVNGLKPGQPIANYLDIIEIDAASNRGIDEIRSLREKISSAPTSLKYKVYIIDEVHMLTREAFNALLKTLEEPPAHAIFIMATTEAHKLPETIISRTQRFDFRPITTKDLVNHLSYIASQEKIKISPAALALIAKASRGGFRDAISLLDQLSVFETPIEDKLIYEILGLSPQEQIKQLVEAIFDYDARRAHLALQTILENGSEPVNLTHQIIEYLRQGFLTAQNIETEAELLYFKAIDQARVIRAIEVFNQALVDFKLTNQYSLPLELAVYQLSLSPAQMQGADSLTIAQTKAANPKAQSAVSSNRDQKAPTKPDDSVAYTKALSAIKEHNNSLYAVINLAESKIAGSQLVLKFSFSFHKERVEESKNRQLIEKELTKSYGRPMTLSCEIEPGRKPATHQDNELIASALEILGGEVVDGEN